MHCFSQVARSVYRSGGRNAIRSWQKWLFITTVYREALSGVPPTQADWAETTEDTEIMVHKALSEGTRAAT
jgi:hypothetical protein